MQYSIDITTEQSFRYMEFIDAKSGFPQIRHYVGFLQIESHIYNNRLAEITASYGDILINTCILSLQLIEGDESH